MSSFERFAGVCAIAASLGGIAYAVVFLVIGNRALYSALLMAGGLLTSVVLVALATRLIPINEPWARWALVVGIVGAMGSVVHGGFNLAEEVNPPVEVAGLGSYPNAIDPRGLLTFGISGLALLTLATLMALAEFFPLLLARLGQLLGILLVLIYLARLIIFEPTNPVVQVAVVAGVVANTVFYAWLGSVLLRTPAGEHGRA